MKHFGDYLKNIIVIGGLNIQEEYKIHFDY